MRASSACVDMKSVAEREDEQAALNNEIPSAAKMHNGTLIHEQLSPLPAAPRHEQFEGVNVQV